MTEIKARSEETLIFDDNQIAAQLYGQGDATLRILEAELDLQVRARGNEVKIAGAPERVQTARKVLEELYRLLRSGNAFDVRDVHHALRMVRQEPDLDLKNIYEGVLTATGARRRVLAKNLSQRRYVELISTCDLVFAIGPAGTGKTYIAMAMAVAALNSKQVARVILARPAVEAGESLGFLPGSLEEKVSPYLRPLYDALHDMMDFEKASRLITKGIIEVAPLAFMRGRTLNDAFVILDEGQNTTREQMKMFLTRLGNNCKAVVTGDVTQIDLPREKNSGLIDACRILKNVEGIGFMHFEDTDVVRHPLVQSIVQAYEREAAAQRGILKLPGIDDDSQ